MAETTTAKKLGIKPGARVVLLQPPEGIAATIGDLPERASYAEPGTDPADVVVAFAHTGADLAAIAPRARDATKAGGYLWFAYPKLAAKTASDLKRETVWEVVGPLIDQRPVTQIALDATWSALPFRPASEVGTT